MSDVVLPFVGMLMAESAQAGLILVSKAAMAEGMSSFVFVFYSNALASLILLPLSLVIHRSQRLPVTFPILCSFFVLALFGCFAQFFGYAGIYYSSATLATAMLNLIPGFTFVLAVTFRMEQLDWGSFSSIAKSVGTLVSIVGAFVMTFYKGLPLLMGSSYSNLSEKFLMEQQSNWVIGGLLLTADCIMGSSWLIIQALILKKFPAEFTVTFYYCFFVAIQSAIVCLALERDLSAWSLAPTSRLIAILYSAFFGSAFQVGVSMWSLRRMGPVFVSMFKPLGIVIAAAIEIMFIGDTLYLGSLVGAIVIVTGFYCIMWGKAKEAKMGIHISGSHESPLLRSNTEENIEVLYEESRQNI